MVIDDHLDTGIFGTQFFFEVLSENGLNELAYRVMNQRTHAIVWMVDRPGSNNYLGRMEWKWFT